MIINNDSPWDYFNNNDDYNNNNNNNMVTMKEKCFDISVLFDLDIIEKYKVPLSFEAVKEAIMETANILYSHEDCLHLSTVTMCNKNNFLFKWE